MRTLAGTKFLMSEITTLEQMSTAMVARPMLMPLMALPVVPRVGHIPNIRTNVGFSAMMPLKSILSLSFMAWI